MVNTKNYLRKLFPRTSDIESTVFVYLLALILIAIPLKHIFGSVSVIIFVAFTILYAFKSKFHFKAELILPILLFLLMALSLVWTSNYKLSIIGLQKLLPLLLIPLAFLFIPSFSKNDLDKLFKTYSYSMVCYVLYFLIKAIWKFYLSGNSTVFFYHELVTKDVNAIYFSVFASLGLFYFFLLEKRNYYEKTALVLLLVFIFLLSSKSIITIDFILVVCYYMFYSKTQKMVKSITVLSISFFLILSLMYVKQVKDRFLLEYETAFIDNTVNTIISNDSGRVYNVSLYQAWTLEKFESNHFFPGTAIRVFQFRIFLEMLLEGNIFLTGLGVEASQDAIRDKANQYNLYKGYGDFNYHNQYLQTFSDIGVFGFLILIIMVFINIKNAIISKNFLHFVFAVTMTILFISESVFCRQRGIVFFIVLFCIFNSSKEKDLNPTNIIK